MSGVNTHNVTDVVWEVYWLFISAVIGLILATVTTFRVLFVSQTSSKKQQDAQQEYYKGRNMLRALLYRSRASGHELETSDNEHGCQMAVLPAVPRATITGIRTFIDSGAIGTSGESRIMNNEFHEGAEGHGLEYVTKGPSIIVRHDISMQSEQAWRSFLSCSCWSSRDVIFLFGAGFLSRRGIRTKCLFCLIRDQCQGDGFSSSNFEVEQRILNLSGRSNSYRDVFSMLMNVSTIGTVACHLKFKIERILVALLA